MKSYKRHSLRSILRWIMAVLLIFEINSVFYNSYNINFHISELIGVVSLIIVITEFKSGIRLKRELLVFICVYELLALLYLAISVDGEALISYSMKFIFFIPMMTVVYAVNSNLLIDIVKKMSRFTVFLAGMSIISYLASFVLPNLGTFTIFWGKVRQAENFLFFFSSQRQEIAGHYVMRNTGIFCEAPMYAFVLIMALAVELFFYKKTKTKSVILLILTIVTTYSVTAVILMMCLMVAKYYYGNIAFEWQGDYEIYKRRKKSATRYLVVLVGVIIASIGVYYLMKFKMNTGLSYSKRIDDYIAGFAAWRQNPIWGVGYGKGEIITANMAEWRLKYTQSGYSNSVMYIVATMGCYGSVLYIAGIYGGIRYGINRKQYFISMQYCVLLILLFVTVVPMHFYVLNYVSFGIAASFYGRKQQLQEIKDNTKF
ncbi:MULTISPECIES: O-antigen ligase family protein [Lachnospiraceae]|uniref:O-antigen ligase-related domain-containing protein n=1 Tax=Muricomes intestini TaxID=1796634 RepID=A0A4R3K115_9FIRM|nr:MULTISPECIES: O-antigen ligase family protein [Lachnospiraceae]TCS74139.1 hypothetical protein EDD59_1428 [Muricomes intestini]